MWRYTRNVVSVAKRLTSLATVLALSGSPAAVAACMAACLHGVPAAAVAHESDVAVAHAGHASSPQPSAASEHAHHATPAAPASAAPAGDPAPSTARLAAGCDDCCPDGQAAVVATSGALRTNALVAGAPLPTLAAPFFAATSGPGAASPVPPVPPPSPTRAPLVLRI